MTPSVTLVDVSTPLTDEQLEQMTFRDDITGDGLVILDHHDCEDRHLLLLEVRRLREITDRRRRGRPVAN